MRYEDASQPDSAGHDTVARPDVDTLPAGSYGPATGNAITGQGTSTGSSGADSVAAGPATIVSVEGAGGQTVAANGAFQAAGQYGLLSMDAQGNFNYVRNANTPDGVKDVFNYTLADAAGANASTTLTIDIAQVAAAAAGQGIVALPAGVELSDIHVNGRDLVINMPDGTQMVIPNGAVFVPEITIGDVQVPPTNIAALLVDSEPQPAAGTPPSSGGNWNDPVPDLDPGVPLGDLIPPTELSHTPPTFLEPAQGIDTEPTLVIQTPDFPAGAVDASESVNEKGLPARNGAEPAGSGEIADGNGSNDSDGSETNTGTIVFTAEDGLQSVTINGTEVSAVGQQIAGEFGTLTITGIDLANGQITYSYTLGDNTSGDSTQDVFAIVVTDDDGDTASGSLTVNIVDDVPTARDDTDSTDLVNHVATGNVMTGADTTSGASGADTVGADNATLTAVSSNGTGAADSSFDSSGNLVVEGSFGTLTIKADGSYTYTAHSDAPGNSTDVFTYTLTDGDGDSDTATLTIINPDHQPTVGTNAVVQLDDDALPGGNPGGVGDDPDSVNTSGTLSGSGGDGDLTFALTANGAPEGFTYQLQSNGSLWVMQGSTHVLTVTVNADTGAYTVTQVAPIDHPADAAENNVAFDVSYTVTDSDGDSVTGHLPINVDDDTPIARNDTDSVAKGAASTDGNVLTGAGTTSGAAGADSPGADGLAGGVVGIHAGTTGSFADVTSAGTVVHGAFGDLVIHADGTYTYTVTVNGSAGGNDVFTYEIVDADGDVATATLTINVPADSIPVAVNASALVDDDGLPAGNHDSAPGDDTQSPDPDNNESTFTGTLTANFGGDAPGSFTFSSDMNGKVVTIGQEQVTYHIVGNVLTAEVTDSPDAGREGSNLFTVTLNANGTYSVDLLENVLQVDDGTNTENNATASIGFTAHDADGDSGNGTLTISFDDDIPVAKPPLPPGEPGGPPTPLLTGLVDEDDLPTGNHDHAPGDDDPIDASGDSDPTTTGGGAGSLGALFNAGADQPLTFGLSSDTSGLPALTSNGHAVLYSVEGGVLTAVADLNNDGNIDAGETTVFTLTVNPDGSWSFNLEGQLDHHSAGTEDNLLLDFSSVIVATDSDGDSAVAAGGAFIVNVDDDLPVANPPIPPEQGGPPTPLVTGLVDEDDLPDGNHDHAPGDDEPIDASGDSDPTTTGGAAGSLAALFNAGADRPLTFGLSADTSGLPQDLTSNGHAVLYNVDGNVLTAVADLNNDGNIDAGETTVFTLTVNPDGSWLFDLEGQLDHPIAGTEDNLLIDLGSVVVAVDADGDPATAAPGAFVINVDDDMPQPFDEANCPKVTILNDAGSQATGQFDLPNVGADDPAKFTFGVTDGTAVLDSGGNPITAEGQALFYFVNDAGVLEAREGGETGDIAFTITLNQDGSFAYNQLIDIDNGGGGVSFDNLTSTSAGNVEFRGVGANNPATTVDLLLSADDNGTDATVNTDSDSVGSANQSMDVGETVRIDFVTDLVTGAATPSQFGYGDHVSSNSFTGLIPQVQGSQSETVAFTVWALDSTNTSAAEPDRNPDGGFSDSSVTAITGVTVTDYLTGNTATLDVTGLAEGVFTPVDFGISVRVNADGSVTFAGIQEGDSYGFTTGSGDFNAVAVQAEPAGTGGSTEDSFDLGVFSIGVANAGEPVDFSVPVVLTDADGDPVTCDIDFSLNPAPVAPDSTVTVNEAGLDALGSDGASNSEIVSGDLSTTASGEGTLTFAFAPGEDGNGAHGTLVLNSDGTFTYTLTSPVDGSDANDGANPVMGVESFSYTVTDSNGVTTTGTLNVTIIDDVPTANADTDTVPSGEDTATGNVITGDSTDGGTSGSGVDVVGADNAHVSGVSSDNVSGHADSDSSGGGFVVVGEFGTLTMQTDGSYSYVRNPTAPDGAQDVFTYTLTDGDGDQDTATLTLTVANGVPTLDVPTTGEAGTLVDEQGLPARNGTEPAGSGEIQDGNPTNNSDPSERTDGTIHFTPGDTPATVTIDGAGIGGPVTITGAGQTIVGAFGTLTIDSYDASGTITYHYVLADNTTGDNTHDDFSVVVTDADGQTASDTLRIDIVDDTPTANNDTDTVPGDSNSAAGNVITGADTDGGTSGTGVDVVGADNAQISGVVSVNEPTHSDTDASGGFVVVGEFGTLTMQTDGSYNYVRNADAPDGAQDVFTYTLTDGDTDSDTATLTITVANSIPSVPENTNVQLDDDALLGGNPGTPDVNDDPDSVNTSGSVAATGGDGTIVYALSESGAPSGFTYDLQANGDLWVIQGSTHVLTITLDQSGNYNVAQVAPIDHAPGDLENNDQFTVTFSATDADGQSDTGTLTIDVDDDTPVISSVTTPLHIDNSGTASATGDFVFSVGADQNADHDDISVSNFAVTVAGNAATNIVLTPGTEDANSASYTFSFDYATGTGGTDHETGTLTFDKTTGEYTVDLDHPIAAFNIVDTSTPGNTFTGYVPNSSTTDNTQPEVSVTSIVTEAGADPILFVQFTGMKDPSGGGITHDAGGDATFSNGELITNDPSWVSTSGSANGVAGDTVQGDEILDFNLYAENPEGFTGGLPTASASTMYLKFDGIGSAEDFVVVLKLWSDTDGNGQIDATDEFTTKAVLVTNSDIIKGPGTGPGDFSGITLDNNDGLIIIESNDYNEAGETYQIVGAEVITDPANLSGTAIDLNSAVGATGGSDADSSGSLDTQSFADDVDGNAPLKISAIGFVTQSSTEQAAQIDFDVTVTDADADSVTQHVTVEVGGTASTTTATTMMAATSLSSDQQSVETSSLMSSNDNQPSISQERALGAGHNAAVMAALAAVGLEADHMRIDLSGVSHASNHASESAPVHTEAFAPVPLQANSSVASAHAAEPVMSSHAVEAAPQSGSQFHDLSQQLQSISHGDARAAQGTTELLHGSEAPAHGPAAHAGAVTAHAVAMPAAAQLAAAAEAHAAAKGGEGVQHNEVVGKVLADSLNGGEGHGPNIDALLAAHGGHSAAPDLIEALASHGAGGVPYGHSGGSSAIAMAHSMFSMAMMHHDAAPPAHG